MKQSAFLSLLESCGSTATGFVLALLAQAIFWPLLGFHISAAQNLISVGIMTIISIARGFAWRRLMESLHVRRPLSPAMAAIIAERARQIEAEGWDAAHDEAHDRGTLARAGANYAWYAGQDVAMPETWPWTREWWKPQNFRRDLVRAAALVLAEIERFDRKRTVARR